MSTIVIALLLLALLLAAVIHYGSATPAVHRVPREKLEYFLSQLFRRGYDGGIAVIRDASRQRFVRVSKYFGSDNAMGLEVSVPTSLCSVDERERLAQWIRDTGVTSRPFESTPVRSAVAYPDNVYTHRRATEVNFSIMTAIDCGSDIAVARSTVESIFSNVFAVERGTGYLVELWGVNLRDELVDRP